MNESSPTPEVTEAAIALAGHLTAAFRILKQLRPELPTRVDGLDHGALPLLFTLDRGEHRVSSLADACHADLSTTSRHATALARLGLVEKTPDETDRRAQVLVITDAGRDVVASVKRSRSILFSEILADWDAGDIRAFDAHLTRFATDVERRLKSGAMPLHQNPQEG